MCGVISVGGSDEADDDRHWLAPFWSALPAAGDTTHLLSQLVPPDRRASACSASWTTSAGPGPIDEINEFEAQQRDHGTLIVKLFFHVSAEMQDERLRERGRKIRGATG